MLVTIANSTCFVNTQSIGRAPPHVAVEQALAMPVFGVYQLRNVCVRAQWRAHCVASFFLVVRKDDEGRWYALRRPDTLLWTGRRSDDVHRGERA